MMTDTTEALKPVKVGDCYKMILRSMNGTEAPDNSYHFNVNLKDIEGETVRCAVKKVRYPAPATYIARRLWQAEGNTWKNSFTDPQGKVNDYNNLLAKYGLNTWIYLYYPRENMYIRILWNNTENASVRQSVFSRSFDGINWSGNSGLSALGLSEGVHYSGGGAIPFDVFEIDITTAPKGTMMQNIHCPQLKASQSFDVVTQTNTDIIGHIGNTQNFNPYLPNDATYSVHDNDCANEISGSALRSLTALNVYFSRVSTPAVKEKVSSPWGTWALELAFYPV